MKLKYTNLVSHMLNLVGLVVILIIVGYSLWAATLIRQATSAVTVSVSLSDTYQQILYTLSAEETSQFEYAFNPTPSIRDEYFAATRALSGLVQVLERESPAGRDTVVQHLLTAQAGYLFYVGRVFAAIDAGNYTLAHTIYYKQLDPSLDKIRNELSQQVDVEEVSVAHHLAELTRVQQTIFVGGLAVLALGLLIVVTSAFVTRFYRRKLDEATQVELARFERMAFTDVLTGLGNHYSYQEQLTNVLEEAQQGGEPLALVLLDIDEFKVVNDEQGHQRGDDILCNVATLLREAKLSDALFRLSADDFAVIMPWTAEEETSFALERLCENVRRLLFNVTVSIGITHTGSGELTLELFQAQAALALQEAKHQGRNRVVTFEAIESDASFVPLAKRQAVRRLLNERKLTVVFQPIWNLATGTVLAYEALSRPDASYGLSGPQELFDIAEQMGRAHELDAVCVEKTLARAADLPPDALLFLNLTPQSLVHDLLTGAILLEAVVSAGLEPSRVVLEITERSIVKLANVVQKAKFLRLMGFRIALDDAGAGNAGLEMLSQLPVDFVKIDRAVVINALTDQAVRSVFVGITTIARESHFSVVAEGIENAEMLDFIQQAGVQYAQGYLLGRPSETIPDETSLQRLSPLAQIA